MKQHVTLAIALLFSMSLFAQIDADRMAKDIEIAENILMKLTQQELQDDAWHDDVEGKYIDGYGIVFTIRTMTEAYAFGFGREQIYIRGAKVGIKGGRRIGGVAVLEGDDVEDEQFDRQDIIQRTAERFLTDYAFLIRQLQPDERILLNFVDDWEEAAVINPFPGNRRSQRRTATLTAEVEYKYVQDLKMRKLTDEEFLDKVKFSEDAKEEARDPDVEMLITILNRLYDEDLSETFVINDAGEYNTIRGLGTIVDLRVHSAGDKSSRWEIRTDWGSFDMNEENEDCNCPDDKEARKEREKEFSEKFEPFIDSFKENVIEYGQTVESLEAGEVLMFHLRFSSFDNKVIDVTVPQDALINYANGSIKLDKAMDEIKVKEGKQRD
ncbi:MAG: hypothetical protein AAGI23_22710 [Bacteroidota bacterium]